MQRPAVIAIVDDSKFMRGLIVKALAQLYPQARVVEFDNATSALRSLPRLKPDLVTLDLLMPEVHGFEFLERLARHRHRPRVIVITADVQQSVRERCAASGAHAFIEKPVTLDKLRRAVEIVFAP
jgi:CheY-like chemotaxis protein